MKQYNLLIIQFVLILTIASAEDLQFCTINPTNLYDASTSSLDFDRDLKNVIGPGEKLIYNTNNQNQLYKQDISGKREVIIGSFYFNNIKYDVDCNNLVPWNTESIFAKSFLTDFNNPDKKIWMLSYYIDVLQSGERETLFEYAPFFSDPANPSFETYSEDGFMEWYDFLTVEFPPGTLSFSNSAIVANDLVGMIIKNITNIPDGYKVTVKFDAEKLYAFEIDNLDFSIVDGKEYFDLICIRDGDYLDVYLEDMNHKVTSYVFLAPEMIEIIAGFINTNTITGEITWPRRGYKTAIEGKNYRTIDTLRLRQTGSELGNITGTIPSGSLVKVINIGKQETIDGIEANWVMVETGENQQGWCFGGYLSAFEEEPMENIMTIPGPVPGKDNKKRVSPFVILIAALFGLVLALGTIQVLIKRKK